MSNYSFVKRINYQKLQSLLDSLNDGEDKEVEQFSAEKSKHGWVIVLNYNDGTEQWSDRASLVRCSFCGEIRELFEGQIEFCYHCGKDW